MRGEPSRSSAGWGVWIYKEKILINSLQSVELCPSEEGHLAQPGVSGKGIQSRLLEDVMPQVNLQG